MSSYVYTLFLLGLSPWRTISTRPPGNGLTRLDRSQAAFLL